MTTPEDKAADAPVDPEMTPAPEVADADAPGEAEAAAAGEDAIAESADGGAASEATAELPEADISDAGSEPAEADAADAEFDSTSARIAALVASLDREAAQEAAAEAGEVVAGEPEASDDEAAFGEQPEAEATADELEAAADEAAIGGQPEAEASDDAPGSDQSELAAATDEAVVGVQPEAEAPAGELEVAADQAAVGVQPEAEATADELEAAAEAPEAAEASSEADPASATEPLEPTNAPNATLGASDAPNATLGAQAEDEGGAEDGVAVGSGLPDLTEDETLHSALEALLLVVDSPAEVEMLADALDEPVKRIRAALKTMAAQYHEQNRGIDLRDLGGGWRFYTRDKYAPYVEKMLHDGQRAKLTRAALESLAVIAYRQPVTRARVAAVRGVNVDGVIRTLVVRGLIEETGTDRDTGGILYRTTELFLERLGLSSLEDLPPIAPLLPEVDAIDDV